MHLVKLNLLKDKDLSKNLWNYSITETELVFIVTFIFKYLMRFKLFVIHLWKILETSFLSAK